MKHKKGKVIKLKEIIQKITNIKCGNRETCITCKERFHTEFCPKSYISDYNNSLAKLREATNNIINISKFL